jgi:LuxR family quorum sensing-dependent transcriptional regulator
MADKFFESVDRLLSTKSPEEVAVLLKEAEKRLNGTNLINKDVHLSKREVSVLTWLSKGKTAWEIGEILHISQRTVEWHTRNAARKLNAVNALQAVATAIKRGLIST